jgi:polysaccharide export outer membrane protein
MQTREARLCIQISALILFLGTQCAVLAQPDGANRTGQTVQVPGTPSGHRPFDEKSQQLNRAIFLRMAKHSTDYVLGVGDKITIEIVGLPSLSGALEAVLIPDNGDISIPLIGPVTAAGLTATQLEERIASALKEQSLVVEPEVLVSVNQYQSKPIYVFGAVDNPGEYVMTQHLTLLEAILMAGGIDPDAGTNGFLYRRAKSADRLERTFATQEAAETGLVAVQPGDEVIRFDLEPLKRGAVPDPDILLQRNDVIIISKAIAEYVYVIGDVNSPGAYRVPPGNDKPFYVTQAISLAGGPTKTAKMKKGILVRGGPSGAREERPVDFDAVLQGEAPNFGVLPSDIIFVPGSGAKTLGYGLLGALPAMVQINASQALQK